MQGNSATVLAIWGVKFHNYAHLKYTNNSVTIHYSLFEFYKTLQFNITINKRLALAQRNTKNKTIVIFMCDGFLSQVVSN